MTPNVESTDLDPMMQGEAPAPELPLSPQARVDASRAALQLWILRTYHPERLPPDPAHAADVGPQPLDNDPPWLAAMIDAASDLPGVAIAGRYLRRWWRRHPLYGTFHLADEAGRELLRPVARTHPWLLLGGAVAVGVLMGRVRPWRYVSRRTLFAGLLPPISLASVLASITAMFTPQPPADPADPDTPDGAPDETPHPASSTAASGAVHAPSAETV